MNVMVTFAPLFGLAVGESSSLLLCGWWDGSVRQVLPRGWGVGSGTFRGRRSRPLISFGVGVVGLPFLDYRKE